MKFLQKRWVAVTLAVLMAVGIYLGLGPFIGKETASWLCILCAAPAGVAGFFTYNGMTLEQFIWAVVKSEILCAGGRRFESHNLHYTLMGRKESDGFD